VNATEKVTVPPPESDAGRLIPEIAKAELPLEIAEMVAGAEPVLLIVTL
jgi:hypothetical protein